MRIRIVDAFTDRPFAGNPAGVCLLDAPVWPDDGWLRSVAAELNLPATAFTHPLTDDAGADFAIRWFSPTAEIRLCGHGTLATAHALREDRGTAGTVRFRTGAGAVLPAHAGEDGAITLDFPAAEPVAAQAQPGLAEALGQVPEAVYGTGTLGDLLVVLPDEATVRELRPDLAALARVTGADSLRGVIVTAVAARQDAGYDFVSRFFAPATGIPEDPVTGSAHTALAPYWGRRLGRSSLVGLQASARTGLVRAAVRGERVHLTGSAVVVLDGVLVTAPVGSTPRGSG